MFIALREIRRSPGRFALLTGAVGSLVLLLLFFQSVAGALTRGLTGGLDNNAAEVIVYARSARRSPVASVLPPELASHVEAVAGVAAVTTAGLSGFEIDDADGVVVGLDPVRGGGPRSLAEGRRAERRGEAVFSGSSLSEGFALGDTIEIEGVELTVVGVARDAAFEVSPTFYVPFADYQLATERRAGTAVDAPISWFGVEVARGSEPGEVARRITDEVAGVEALDRASAAAALPGAGQVTQSFSILYMLLFIVVTVVTGVFFLILAVHKERSLVLLRAVGATRLDVVLPVLLQVVAVAGTGAALGSSAAAGLLWLARDTFGSTLDLKTVASTAGFILVLGLVASLGAVRRVLAVDPIQAATTGTGTV